MIHILRFIGTEKDLIDIGFKLSFIEDNTTNVYSKTINGKYISFWYEIRLDNKIITIHAPVQDEYYNTVVLDDTIVDMYNRRLIQKI